jgi:alginate O-acetyltransferase complex protein AlgI
MLFSQALFLPFLLATFLLWLPFGRQGRKIVLVMASLVFYGSWDLRFLPLLGFVWLVVLGVPAAMDGASGPVVRRRWLLAGVAALLLVLFVCKYLNFFLDSARALVGAGRGAGALRLILPAGISFYTFQAIGYLVDCHRKRLPASRSPLDTALFVTFFPLLLAGPIEKGARWLPQLAAYQPLRLDGVRDGVERMLLGYVLKVGIADPLAPFCNDIFARAAGAGSGELWAGALAYSVQIFADFAGYSLIARGVAKLFGYEVVNNFEQPYFSRSFSEFWRRWHISLSKWIWEYLFNPLVSAFLRRVGRLNLATVEAEMRIAYPCAALLAMLLCGLWHGAGWTYVVWGGLHGMFLIVERLFIFGNRQIAKRRRGRGPRAFLRALLAGGLVFLLVTLAWVIFRAPTLRDAAVYLQRMFTAGGWIVQKKALVLLGVGFLSTLIIEWVAYRREDEWVFRGAGRWRGLAYAAALVYLVFFGSSGAKVPFIYFQF